MLEPLPTYQTRIHALNPACADVRIHFDNLPAEVEVRGRLMGPRCPGISTVEVAYRLKPLPEHGTFQVVIPEPNLWESDRPCRYEGPVEFWQDGQMVGKTTVSIGLRQA
jgi:hypothetical protein